MRRSSLLFTEMVSPKHYTHRRYHPRRERPSAPKSHDPPQPPIRESDFIRPISVSFDQSYLSSRNADREREDFEKTIVDRITHADKPPQRPKNIRGRDIGLFYARNARSKKDRVDEVLVNAFEVPNVTERLSDLSHSPADLPIRISQIAANCFQRECSGTRNTPRSGGSEMYSELRKNDSLDMVLFEQFQKCVERRRPDELSRNKLPIHDFRNQIIQAILENQVIVLTGETGCGKSTQIPQYILENEVVNARNGSMCRILCTQPRRICATSLSNRVAHELNNSDAVGYHIRFDSKLPRNTRGGSVTFCTTGIALKYIESDELLRGFSHIIVDEVHERALETELFLIYLKRLLYRRRDVKVILMSASVQADKFSEWIKDGQNVPLLNVPTRTYQVERVFLEDWAEDFSRFYTPSPPQWGGRSEPPEKSKYDDYLRFQLNVSSRARRTLYSLRFDKVNIGLIVAAVKKICLDDADSTNPRSILIFVPGMQDIRKVISELEKLPRLHLLPLHSLLASTVQSNVFQAAPEGKRKVVIATNIAESSITIDDVGFVLETGLSKQEGFDTNIGTRLLQQQWITRANVKQRLGRAGRCANGVCFHLYTRYHFNEQMAEYPKSELLTNRLDGVILQVKNNGIADVRDFLSSAIDAPSEALLSSSIDFLTSIDALDAANHNLTPLGAHLARLPCEAQIGKLVLFGVLFDCIEPLLTIAAFLSSSDPFHVVPGNESEVDKIRAKFRCGEKGPLAYSDHFMLLRIFNEYSEINRRLGNAREFCALNWLSENKLRNVKNVRKQLWDVVKCLNFVSPRRQSQDYNANGDNMDLLAFILCFSFYPNIAKAKPLVSKERNLVLTTPHNKTLMVSLRSLCANLTMTTLPAHYFTYFDKVKSGSTVVYDLSPVNPLSLMFCAQKITSSHKNHRGRSNTNCPESYVLDEWLNVRARPRDVSVVGALRQALNRLIADLLINPRTIQPNTPEHFIISSIIGAVTSKNLVMNYSGIRNEY